MPDSQYRKDIWLFLSKDNQTVLFDGESQYTLKYQEHCLILDAKAVYSGHTQSWLDFLPGLAVDKLSDFLNKNKQNYLYLHVHEKLDITWKDYPWEYLYLQGKSLFGRIVVERDSALCSSQFTPFFISPNTPSVFLNMFPVDELDGRKFPYSQLCNQNLDFKRTYRLAINFCSTQDLSALAMLIVFVHGSELGEDSLPFCLPDKEKTKWALPETSLPPIILLLSCGSEDGNLSSYSRQVLKQGAKVVISAVGKINSTQVISLFSKLWEKWNEGKNIGDILRQLQGRSEQEYGAKRLRIFGNGDICKKPENVSLEEQKNDTLAGAYRNYFIENQKLDFDITKILLERAILLQELLNKPWDLIFKDFVETDNFKINDIDFLDKISVLKSDFPHQIKCHLYPYLIVIAERNKHGMMNEFQHEYSFFHDKCQQIAATYYRTSLYYYRNGDYKKILQNYLLAQDENDYKNYQIHFYRLILSISTDLLLPQLGESLKRKIDNALVDLSDVLPSEVLLNEQWSSRDTNSRYLLRLGKYQKSYELMKIKSREAQKYNSNREKSWLLYISSIGQTHQVARNAEIIQKEIGSFDELIDKWGLGNSDIAYQIRALSLWCYIYKQSQIAKKLLEGLLNIVSTLLEEDKIRDYAPIGFSLVFLKLAVDTVSEFYDSIWSSVCTHMEESKYYAELMSLYVLLNDKENAIESMNNFHLFRKSMLRPFLDVNEEELEEFNSLQFKNSLINREKIEAGLINQLPFETTDPEQLINKLVQAQIMPQ